MQKLLLLQVGHTFEEIARERGDYDVWFRDGLGLAPAQLEVARVFDGAPVPRRLDYDAVVVTGSWSMVTDREPWSEACADYLRGAVEARMPVLGVCYGHQLLAHALGGLVGYNPAGRHAGTALVELTEAAREDPLFRELPSPLQLHVSHSQRVIDPPAEAVVLAHTALDPYHAFRVGECAWGVQFHPEFDAETARAYIQMRYATIAAEGLDPDALMQGVKESPHGRDLLRRFAALL